MEATSSADFRGAAFGNPSRAALLKVAREVVARGIGGQWQPDPSRFTDDLQAVRACFVTLHLDGCLRGCVGTLEARHPLVVQTARSAHGAAFRDPRFPAVGVDEVLRLHYHISVLSPPEPLRFDSERELLELLQPGVDGVVLRDCGRSGTFLPEVWRTFPDPLTFLRHLRAKAGLAEDHWSATLTVARYTTESFGDDA